jgi:folate-binding protein YgfZ
MLDHKGSPIWDFYVFKDSENYILDFEFDRDEVLNKLKQLKLSYQVFFEVLEFEHIYIFGEDSEKFIQQTFNEAPEKFKYLKLENIYIANNPLRLGQKGFDIFGNLESIKSNLPTDLKIDEEEFENLRINNCIPKIGKELVEKVLPLETNIWKYAISLNKGCYVGQEAIARVYFRGKPPRVMVKFSFDNVLDENEKVLLNDKPVGFITSVNIKDKTAIGFILRNIAESGKELKSSQSVLKILNICQELNV